MERNYFEIHFLLFHIVFIHETRHESWIWCSMIVNEFVCVSEFVWIPLVSPTRFRSSWDSAHEMCITPTVGAYKNKSDILLSLYFHYGRKICIGSDDSSRYYLFICVNYDYNRSISYDNTFGFLISL